MSFLQEILDSLSDMYELLQEEDMWSGLWQKHSRYRETNIAIAYEQQGFFEQAQVSKTYSLKFYSNIGFIYLLLNTIFWCFQVNISDF